jgi:hypothetical protein
MRACGPKASENSCGHSRIGVQRQEYNLSEKQVRRSEPFLVEQEGGQEVENLTGRLEALENSARELAAAMRDAAAGLENGSLGLALGLPERIQQLSQDYWALSREIQELARQHGVQFDPPTGMRDLAVLLGRVQEKIESSRREAWQQARDQVLSILEKVGRLVHREGVPLDALEKVKQTARALEAQIRQSEWPATPPEQAELESGQHPLVALLRLVEEGHALSDEEWERLHDVVRGAYPSELVTPVVRGKLKLAEVAPPAPTPGAAGIEPAEGKQAEEGEIREGQAPPPEAPPVEEAEAESAPGVGVIETVPGGGASVEARIEEEKEGYQPQWQDTFDRFCGEGDHRSTARILAYLERIGQLGVVEELERIRAKSLKDWQERLDSEIRQTQLELENAVAQGLLTEELRTRHAGVIETLTAMVPEMTEFGEAFLELDKVRQSIACERQRRVEECRERMRREGLESHPFRTRIEELLEQGTSVSPAQGPLPGLEPVAQLLSAGDAPGVEDAPRGQSASPL